MLTTKQAEDLSKRFHTTAFTADDIRQLELVVLNVAWLKPYLAVVNDARKAVGRPVETHTLDYDTDWPAVAERGLAALSRERVAELAADVVALIDLRERLYDTIPAEEVGKPGASLRRRLPPYWAGRNSEHAAASLARTPEIVARLRERIEAAKAVPSEMATATAAPPERAFALLGLKHGPLPAVGVADRMWPRDAPLTVGNFLAVRDTTAAADAVAQRVTIRCHWFEAARRLEVQFVGGCVNLGRPGSEATPRLIVPHSDTPPVDGTATANRRLAFEVPETFDHDVTDATLAVIYRCAEFDAEVLIPLSGPGAN